MPSCPWYRQYKIPCQVLRLEITIGKHWLLNRLNIRPALSLRSSVTSTPPVLYNLYLPWYLQFYPTFPSSSLYGWKHCFMVIIAIVYLVAQLWQTAAGVYLVVFATAVYFRKRATKGLTPSLVIVVAFLMYILTVPLANAPDWFRLTRFAICTAHIAINLRRLIEGFILTQTKPQTLAYFYQFNDPLVCPWQRSCSQTLINDVCWLECR